MDAEGEFGMGLSVDAGAGQAVWKVSAYECGVHWTGNQGKYRGMSHG